MIRTAISGAAGRMGRRLVDLIAHEQGMCLTAALEQPGHSSLGRDAGELAGCGRLGLPITSDWPEPADILIDFSSPDAAVSRAAEAAAKGAAILVGTTGLSEAQKACIESASHRVPVLISPNMSIGVNLLFKIAAEVATALGAEYDVEIVETHHRFKKDAPSGTALHLARQIAAASGRRLQDNAIYGRHGVNVERKPGEIGIHAVRLGDVVGDHTVIFSSLGERIELVHRAHTRDTFVRGAIRAAKFLVKQKPGLYSMAEVLSAS